MIKKIKVFSVGAALVVLSCLPVFAAGYAEMSTEELAGLRITMQQESREVRAAFQMEWQARVREMSREQKQQYMGRGKALGPQDGTGAQHRKGKRGSGAGAGMGSGSGRGGRR
ncbi:MAG: hypothetical protein ABFQ82_00815 [Thermodesulfobacteriota bacterium]